MRTHSSENVSQTVLIRTSVRCRGRRGLDTKVTYFGNLLVVLLGQSACKVGASTTGEELDSSGAFPSYFAIFEPTDNPPETILFRGLDRSARHVCGADSLRFSICSTDQYEGCC